MFKHNSLQLGLQLLFLGWMTTFTMNFKWVSKHIRKIHGGQSRLHNKQGCKHRLSNNHESTKQQGCYFPMTET
jgi:hypothetical protein